MNASVIHTVMTEARNCAMAMLDSGTYIERELPNVRMDDAARTMATALCSQLIGTKHDIIHELFELDELLSSDASDDRVASAVALIIQWLWDDICQMHELVTTLEAATHGQADDGGAYLLVAESAVNILNPFNRAKAAADLITQTNATGNA